MLDHQAGDVRGFYSAFTGEVVVGIEASGYSAWFVELVEGLGHEVLRLLRYRHKLVQMRKGRVRRLAGRDAQGQAKFVASLFHSFKSPPEEEPSVTLCAL